MHLAVLETLLELDTQLFKASTCLFQVVDRDTEVAKALGLAVAIVAAQGVRQSLDAYDSRTVTTH